MHAARGPGKPQASLVDVHLLADHAALVVPLEAVFGEPRGLLDKQREHGIRPARRYTIREPDAEGLEEGGPDVLTVQRVVSRAGSSVGSFYARFAGKEAVGKALGFGVFIVP